MITRLDTAEKLQPGDIATIDDQGGLARITSEPQTRAGRVIARVKRAGEQEHEVSWNPTMPLDVVRSDMPPEPPQAHQTAQGPKADYALWEALVSDTQALRGDLEGIRRRLAIIERGEKCSGGDEIQASSV